MFPQERKRRDVAVVFSDVSIARVVWFRVMVDSAIRLGSARA